MNWPQHAEGMRGTPPHVPRVCRRPGRHAPSPRRGTKPIEFRQLPGGLTSSTPRCASAAALWGSASACCGLVAKAATPTCRDWRAALETCSRALAGFRNAVVKGTLHRVAASSRWAGLDMLACIMQYSPSRRTDWPHNQNNAQAIEQGRFNAACNHRCAVLCFPLALSPVARGGRAQAPPSLAHTAWGVLLDRAAQYAGPDVRPRRGLRQARTGTVRQGSCHMPGHMPVLAARRAVHAGLDQAARCMQAARCSGARPFQAAAKAPRRALYFHSRQFVVKVAEEVRRWGLQGSAACARSRGGRVCGRRAAAAALPSTRVAPPLANLSSSVMIRAGGGGGGGGGGG